jgi:hypothetical protein
MRISAFRTGVVFSVLVAAPALAAPAMAPPPSAGDPVHYRVRQGDTLYDLARKYLIRLGDYDAVRKSNGVRDPRELAPGTDLAIPAAWLRTEPIDATVETVSGAATVTAKGRTAALDRGAILHEGETVATGADTFVRLGLPDGTHVTLPSQSRLRIAALHRILLTDALVRDFALEGGRSEAVVTPMTKPQDHFIVRTPLAIAAVRGTDFRVAFDPDVGRAGVGVLEGAVGVSTADGGHASQTVPASFGVSVGTEGVSTPRALLPAPKLKSGARVQQAPQVSLDIEPVAGAKAYRAQLAPDAGMMEPVAETEVETPALSFPKLADGQWFVRLTAIDDGGLEGAPKTYGFQRILNDVNLKSPAGQRLNGVAGWRFEWDSHGAGKASYRFQLFGEGKGIPPLIDEAGLSEPRITISGLPDGNYHWRVRSTLQRNGHAFDSWSPMQDFGIGP